MSTTVKGWAITLASASFGVAVIQDVPLLHVLGLVVVAIFGYLDSKYLSTEKHFRNLYDEIVANSCPPLSLTPPSGGSNASHRSWAIWGFYGPFAAVGVLLLILSPTAGNVATEQNIYIQQQPPAAEESPNESSKRARPAAPSASQIPAGTPSRPAKNPDGKSGVLPDE